MNTELLELKKKYIPMFARGEISERACAKKIGIQPVSAWRLKNRYVKFGDKIFIHGNKGRPPANKKYDKEKIVSDYNNFRGTPFGAFRDDCQDYLGYSPSYSTVYNALSSAGIISPEARMTVREKKKHLPRSERPNEGDLVQIDASTHDWFMNGHKVALHGAIDDATHKITGLYFCENECLLGYNQLLQQIFLRNSGKFPRSIYSDRSSCFFVSRGNVSIQEQLAGIEKTQTQWQKTCSELDIELIAAYSPQAKGRIERLWRTLQGRLPFVFRFLRIDTVEKANEFLVDYIDGFNARFAVEAQDKELHWKAPPHNKDFDFLFSVRTEKKTRVDGSFVYHGYKFNLLSARSACVKFTLCLSESFGLKAYMNGMYYDIDLAEPLSDVYGDTMPKVEKDLIYRYFYADSHASKAVVQKSFG
ncbi:ISNCY family transposase [Treponema pectinovorum]|uniref:ISNCY family transposase n=1 Tax=Treponema pectinovorum TaxID=164 RepID=UPI0011CC9334|nr:ISNCY family transposase [Treponema pectinovorum]